MNIYLESRVCSAIENLDYIKGAKEGFEYSKNEIIESIRENSKFNQNKTIKDLENIEADKVELNLTSYGHFEVLVNRG